MSQEQKVMIVQIPSEANAERLICTRIGDANAEGWRVTQMMDHNGFLVLLLARPVPVPEPSEGPPKLPADHSLCDLPCDLPAEAHDG